MPKKNPRINVVLLDKKGKKISINSLKKAAENALSESTTSPISVVYANTEVVNDNGLLIHDGSIVTDRERYPLLYEHSDIDVNGVVGYITTDARANDQGQLTGNIYFYNTDSGNHAAQLFNDGVLNSLSVSYIVTNANWIDSMDGDKPPYLDIQSALLKEVSLVSTPADSDTGRVADSPTPAAVPDSSEETQDAPQSNAVHDVDSSTLVDESKEDTKKDNGVTEDVQDEETNEAKSKAKDDAQRVQSLKNALIADILNVNIKGATKHEDHR